MVTRNERVFKQLGVSHGSASNRLRKQLLFKYVSIAGDHFCFKCGQEIESVDDFSIEHKEPWEGRSAESFWNLDNIAFSHMRCNRPEKYTGKLPRVNPEGLAWCSRCKEYLPREHFSKDRNNRYHGLQHYCKPCHKIIKKRYISQ